MVKLTGRRTRSLKLANGITHAVTRSIKAAAWLLLPNVTVRASLDLRIYRRLTTTAIRSLRRIFGNEFEFSIVQRRGVSNSGVEPRTTEPDGNNSGGSSSRTGGAIAIGGASGGGGTLAGLGAATGEQNSCFTASASRKYWSYADFFSGSPKHTRAIATSFNSF